MMTSAKFDEIHHRALADGYVAGTIGSLDVEVFERHLIECRECQEAVRLGAAIRQAGREYPSAVRPVSRGRRLVRTLSLLAAASIVAVVVGTKMLAAARLSSLGNVGKPPAYNGIEVRTAQRRGDSLFGVAMQKYTNGRIEEARALLRAARSDGADSVTTSFFIGVADLLSGEARSAITELSHVQQLMPNSYSAEAHYYTAKAWLRLGVPDSARAHLERVKSGTPISSPARALADSISERRR